MTRPARFEDAAGFTVVELAITMLISSIVMVAISAVLVQQSNAERDVTKFTMNQEDVRQAVIAIGQDLRSAEPLTEVSNPLDLRYRVDLKVYESVTSETPDRIRWRIDPVTNELLREIIDDADNVLGITHRLPGVVNMSQNAPLFRYYRADNIEYDLGAIGTTAGTVAQCTVRVQIDLRGEPYGGNLNPVRLLSDVQLRNRLPGDPVCAG